MSHARRIEKIQNATQGIKDAGWGSMNQFLLAFYTSDNPEVLQQSHSSLSYTKGQSFAPEKILDAWLKNGPTGTLVINFTWVETKTCTKILYSISSAMPPLQY